MRVAVWHVRARAAAAHATAILLAARSLAHGQDKRDPPGAGLASAALVLVEPPPFDGGEVDPLALRTHVLDMGMVSAALESESERPARVLELLVAHVVGRDEPAADHRL